MTKHIINETKTPTQRHPELVSGSHNTMKQSYIYILANKYRTTFYIGVTVNLSKRIIEHKESVASKFTKKYNVIDLIYFEEFTDINKAIVREKQLKNWHKELNPTLKTLDY